MDDQDRLQLYSAFAVTSRKWTPIMDAKAAFLSSLNGAALAFLWSGLKVEQWAGVSKLFATVATVGSICALMSALLVIIPREKFSVLVGKRDAWAADNKLFSFYGYVANRHGAAGKSGFRAFADDCQAAGAREFALEALEQHHAISCVIQNKSDWVFRAGCFTLLSLTCIGVAMFVKLVAA